VTQSTTKEVSRLLAAWSEGDGQADERLFALLYDELRRLAAHHRRQEPAHPSLQTTALVHEAYLRLAVQKRTTWKSRGHFFAVASQAMRRVLVDHARRRKAAKRGGGLTPSPLDSVVLALESSADLVELDLALSKLAELDPRGAQVVELRFFGGISIPEVARTLELSRATVERDWAAARAWLRRELDAGGAGGGGGDAPGARTGRPPT
jgi:RNA polymerase sigma-70 factor, ECF subfamily